MKIIVPLKYLSNFWRSLEIPLIDCILSSAGNNSTFTITDAKLYVPIVILSAEDNAKLWKLLGEGFKRPVYWNKYKVIPKKIVEIAANNEEKVIRELLDSSCQGVKRLFVLAYNNTASNDQVSIDSFKKYFLPRVKIENYNIEIDGRNFYDQPINDSIKQYNKIAVDLSKQKALDADSRAIQQIIFTGKIKAAANNTRVMIY